MLTKKKLNTMKEIKNTTLCRLCRIYHNNACILEGGKEKKRCTDIILKKRNQSTYSRWLYF